MSNKRKDKFNILTLLAIISFFIASLTNGTRIYFDWIDSGFSTIYEILTTFGELSWLIGQSFVYLLVELSIFSSY